MPGCRSYKAYMKLHGMEVHVPVTVDYAKEGYSQLKQIGGAHPSCNPPAGVTAHRAANRRRSTTTQPSQSMAVEAEGPSEPSPTSKASQQCMPPD